MSRLRDLLGPAPMLHPLRACNLGGCERQPTLLAEDRRESKPNRRIFQRSAGYRVKAAAVRVLAELRARRCVGA